MDVIGTADINNPSPADLFTRYDITFSRVTDRRRTETFASERVRQN